MNLRAVISIAAGLLVSAAALPCAAQASLLAGALYDVEQAFKAHQLKINSEGHRVDLPLSLTQLYQARPFTPSRGAQYLSMSLLPAEDALKICVALPTNDRSAVVDAIHVLKAYRYKFSDDQCRESAQPIDQYVSQKMVYAFKKLHSDQVPTQTMVPAFPEIESVIVPKMVTPSLTIVQPLVAIVPGKPIEPANAVVKIVNPAAQLFVENDLGIMEEQLDYSMPLVTTVEEATPGLVTGIADTELSTGWHMLHNCENIKPQMECSMTFTFRPTAFQTRPTMHGYAIIRFKTGTVLRLGLAIEQRSSL